MLKLKIAGEALIEGDLSSISLHYLGSAVYRIVVK